MYRFYCPDLPAPPSESEASSTQLSDDGPLVSVDRDQAHHAKRVMRLMPGDVIELFNGNGRRATAVIENWENPARLRLLSLHNTPPPAHRLEVAVCMPKGPRATDMVNQLSQLAVDRFIPLIARRSVVLPRQHRMDRLAAAAIESAKQCRRDHLMAVDAPTPFAQALQCDCALKLIADREGAAQPIGPGKNARVLIGPEGGFTDEERAAAESAGYRRWRLASNVLRIETAACAAAAILRNLLD